MHLRTSLFFLAPAVLGLAALAARAQAPFQSARLPAVVPVRWAIALDADRPFYAVGDTLRARCTLANWSTEDAANWSLVQGNGCNVRLELLDAAGQTVWEPGSIVGGTFSAPGCLFGQRAHLLAAGSDQVFGATIPLIFQNGAGVGTLGAPLPAGLYQLAVTVNRFGPERPPSFFGPGLIYEARVPIAIE